MQSRGDFIYLLAFIGVYALLFAVMWVLYKLGNLPGRIASTRKHPQAAAISVLGWIGLLVFFLWPIVLLWALMRPTERRHRPRTPSLEDVDAVEENVREASEQVAAIKRTLANLASAKNTA